MRHQWALKWPSLYTDGQRKAGRTEVCTRCGLNKCRSYGYTDYWRDGDERAGAHLHAGECVAPEAQADYATAVNRAMDYHLAMGGSEPD